MMEWLDKLFAKKSSTDVGSPIPFSDIGMTPELEQYLEAYRAVVMLRKEHDAHWNAIYSARAQMEAAQRRLNVCTNKLENSMENKEKTSD